MSMLKALPGFLYSQLFVQLPAPSQSFDGQTVIVTGSNVGLGKEAARHLVNLGAAKVILAVRNLQAGDEARKDILATTAKDQSVVEVWELDLASYDSVKAFASRASTSLDRIDVLLENAGISTQTFSLAEGHERTMTVNVISTFLLALLLLPKLKETAKNFKTEPRLTIVSSEVHGFLSPQIIPKTNMIATLDDKNYVANRYFTSKLVELLVIREIAPQIRDSPVILNTLNPGLCYSSLANREPGFIPQYVLPVFLFLLARTTEVGSRTLVAAAAAGRESHGQYMYDSKVNESAVSEWVKSDEGALVGRRTWEELKDILEKIQPGVTNVLRA